ncbi:MAG: M15 family metallopeptidase [Cocleimonas sp.]|nr:M15 family metallopeptidase [Cocleimonas sp.]
MKLTHQLFCLVALLSLNNLSAEDLDKGSDLNTVIQGRFNPATHKNFVKIDKKYTPKSGIYLNNEAYDAFIKMRESAKKDNIDLNIVSATRNFNGQKRIWERKWKRDKLSESVERAKKILRYSSMPSTSRHHWGTDIDINSVASAYFLSKKGQKEYLWLQNNAKDFGFCQPYTAKGEQRKTGYNEEKWHWSYINIAKQYTNHVRENFTNSHIHGFLGSETASDIDIVSNYIFGINKDCL